MRTAEESRAHALLWSHTDKSTDCWIWQRGRNTGGYGTLFWGDKRWYAHRLAYTLANGPIPKGLHVCHKCDNPPCINPGHLFVGTARDNALDMVRKGRHRYILPTVRPRGGQGSRTSVNESQVIEMREKRAAGALLKDLAREYGMTNQGVRAICRGVNWAHVGGPRVMYADPATYIARGERISSSKLAPDDVRSIRRRYAEKSATVIEMAAEYSMTRRGIYKIINRENWAEVA